MVKIMVTLVVVANLVAVNILMVADKLLKVVKVAITVRAEELDRVKEKDMEVATKPDLSDDKCRSGRCPFNTARARVWTAMYSGK